MIKQFLFGFIWALGMLISGPAMAQSPQVHQLTIDGPIGPATADYVTRGLTEAAEANAAAVILQMDTPGGLAQAMRRINQAILAAPLPVIGYVAPAGARAASAGTYLLYASHIAVMAPGTNLGAATPVRVGGMPGGPSAEQTPSDADNANPPKSASERKMINDAVAYLRALAELRGRNADWAERAVRDSVSLSAQAALDQGVINRMAGSSAELLTALNGQSVKVNEQTQVLALDNAEVLDRSPDWREQLLATITHPNIAYILLLVGIYGLIFELANPGAMVPGVIGGIALLLGLFALQALPVNYAGLGLLGLGVLLMLAEALVPSFGALGVGGVFAFGLGSLLLFDAQGPGFELSLLLVGGVTAASLVVFLGTASLAVRAYRRRGVAGVAHMQGAEGEVIATDPQLWVRVESERWQAESDQAMQMGQRVRVTDIHGLHLEVEPIAATEDEQ